MTTRLRILRLKYGIALDDLAEKAQISNQQLSRVELGVRRANPYQEAKAAAALEEWIAAQKAALSQLEAEYFRYKGRLLRPMEDQSDEL